jgi:hypothetical protein
MNETTRSLPTEIECARVLFVSEVSITAPSASAFPMT